MDIEEMMEAMDSGTIEAEDGCIVELDGICPHGKKSPFLLNGMI